MKITTTNNSKKNSKKFNLIYFVDSEKTYHFKFNFLFVKIFIIFIILFVIISLISIFISIRVINKNQTLEEYIIGFKKSLLEEYFENEILKEEKKNEINTASILNHKSQIASTKQIDKDKEPVADILENTGIKLENTKLIQTDDVTKILFSLSNVNLKKNIISGYVCGVVLGVNNNNENTIFKIPEKLNLNLQNIPASCKGGEKVKFSRLRPTEFIIKLDKKLINIKKVYIYFSFENKNGIVINSF